MVLKSETGTFDINTSITTFTILLKGISRTVSVTELESPNMRDEKKSIVPQLNFVPLLSDGG